MPVSSGAAPLFGQRNLPGSARLVPENGGALATRLSLPYRMKNPMLEAVSLVLEKLLFISNF